VIMKAVSCCHCGGYFIPDPRQKKPRYCSKLNCQRARKASWQRRKVHDDPAYRSNQKRCQEDWCRDHTDYWKRYREKNPEQANRNRDLQQVRNRKRKGLDIDVQTAPFSNRRASMIAKMDASQSCETSADTPFYGQFWLVPVIAKMDALKVNIYRITSR